jgi:parallel beta-helix repeat protein
VQAATAAVGSGIDLSGGRNNTVQYNLVTNNSSWGILLNDYADYSTPASSTYCQGGELNFTPVTPYDLLYAPLLPIPCYFPSFGNRVIGNVFAGNGFFGNETNGDLANGALPYTSNNCFHDNIDVAGKVTSSPSNLPAVCGKPWKPDTAKEVSLTEELGCASLGLCTGLPFPLNPTPSYPAPTRVRLMPMPHEAGMADPCDVVSANSWCGK